MKSPAEVVTELLETMLQPEEGEPEYEIFLGFQPDTPDHVITVYDQEGEMTQTHTRQLWETPRIQIRIRGLTYENAYATMMVIQKGLILMKPFVEDGYAYEGFVAFGSPYNLGLDENKRASWSLNFRVHRKEFSS